MTKRHLLSNTKSELLKLAKKYGLKRVSTLRKDELAAKIAEISAQREPVEAKPTRKTVPKTAKAAAKTSPRRLPRRKKAAPEPLSPSQPVAESPPPVEQQIEASKYELAPPPPPTRRFEEEYLGELPESYGTGKLFLTARDPHGLYAYWDFSYQRLAEFRQAAVNGRVVLRLFESGASHPAQEITIGHDSKEWYIHGGKANTAYHAELGYWRRGGGFETVSRSRQAKTPSDALSQDKTARFVTIPLHFTFRDLLHLIYDQLQGDEKLAEAFHRLQADGHKFPFDVGVGGTLTAEQEEALLKVFDGDILRRIQTGSFEISEWLRRRLLQGVGSDAMPHTTALKKPAVA